MNVTLLGPQRKTAAARAAVAELMPSGPIATVNAGWQERESESTELDEVLGGRMCNLELWRRWQELQQADPEYAAAERRLTDVLAEMQALYAIRLGHAMEAVESLTRRNEVPTVQQAALADAVRAVQALDDWHLQSVAEARAEFYAAVRLGERDQVLAHRADVDRMVADAAGMVFAGGHVGVLLHVLHVFDLGRLIRPPLVAWSAGAMALAERVVLFHDHAPQGRRHSELYAEGFGVFSSILPFPHARRRLRLDDAHHLGLMARRFAPRSCLLLADGIRIDLHDHQPLPPGARYLSADHGVVQVPTAGEA
ncbi:hypothetical protein GCM10009841_03250 [Microlunatus panaciterrae]|uniref:Uncharacterized protein n=1 Tax=Microlunatus panaciterrae TaxID=400768 RepID=A0ABS2RJ44_9ACTN|nr:hypothetical protein [Microlunatus panaciterrae]MBM7799014.1 hypothetical protein [Microlunatus panaciterrae]